MAWNDPPSFNLDQMNTSAPPPLRKFRYPGQTNGVADASPMNGRPAVNSGQLGINNNHQHQYHQHDAGAAYHLNHAPTHQRQHTFAQAPNTTSQEQLPHPNRELRHSGAPNGTVITTNKSPAYGHPPMVMPSQASYAVANGPSPYHQQYPGPS